MIVLDTNVISEMMKGAPDSNALAWLNGQDANTLFVTSVSLAEVGYGLSALPEGKRRSRLEDAFAGILDEAFEGRILPFDEAAAHRYGPMMAARRQHGRPMSVADGFIAAIALSRGSGMATRNRRDFEGCGLTVIDPFVGPAT